MKNQKGITMTALMITIIVMLILSGVAIKAIIEDDGLILKTNKSVEKYRSSEEEDILNVSYSKVFMRSELNNNEIATGDLEKEIGKHEKEARVIISSEDSNLLVVTFLETGNVYFVNLMTGNIEERNKYKDAISDVVFEEGDIVFESNPEAYIYTSNDVTTTMKLKERNKFNSRSKITMD